LAADIADWGVGRFGGGGWSVYPNWGEGQFAAGGGDGVDVVFRFKLVDNRFEVTDAIIYERRGTYRPGAGRRP
jgi:hypothetical protein